MTTLTADRWIYATLSGDATLTGLVGSRIYADIAPSDSTFPAVVYNLMGMNPVQVVGMTTIARECIYQVKVIHDSGSYATCETIIERIRTLLQGAVGSATGGAIVQCNEDGDSRFVEFVDGKVYRHMAVSFRILVQ